MSINKKIPSELYWEWRCTIEELKTAKLNEKCIQLEKELKKKEIELYNLNLSRLQEYSILARNKVISAELEYENMKKKIEKKIGMSLNDCIIDATNFEVKKVPLSSDKSSI